MNKEKRVGKVGAEQDQLRGETRLDEVGSVDRV